MKNFPYPKPSRTYLIPWGDEKLFNETQLELKVGEAVRYLPPIFPLDLLKTWWGKLSPEEQQEFLTWVEVGRISETATTP